MLVNIWGAFKCISAATVCRSMMWDSDVKEKKRNIKQTEQRIYFQTPDKSENIPQEPFNLQPLWPPGIQTHTTLFRHKTRGWVFTAAGRLQVDTPQAGRQNNNLHTADGRTSELYSGNQSETHRETSAAAAPVYQQDLKKKKKRRGRRTGWGRRRKKTRRKEGGEEDRRWWGSWDFLLVMSTLKRPGEGWALQPLYPSTTSGSRISDQIDPVL